MTVYITVAETAERLGVSQVEIRRRLRTGRIKGQKLGRDWHVDEGDVPKIAPSSSSVTDEFTTDELKQAIRQLSSTDSSELWLPDPLNWNDYRAQVEPLAATIADTLKSSYHPQECRYVRVPKNAFATRPGALLEYADRVVYHAAAARVARAITPQLSPRVVSGGLSNQQKKYLIRPQAPEWVRWRRSHIESARKNNQLIVRTDLSAYFETIDHSTLLRELRERTNEHRALEVIKQQLQRWSPVPGRGLPQGPVASRILGNAYLMAVDDVMIQAGYDYWRFMDDIAVVVPDLHEGHKALDLLTRECFARGLLIGGNKTVTLTVESAKKEIDDAQLGLAEYLHNTQSKRATGLLSRIFKSAFNRDELVIDTRRARFALGRLAQRRSKGALASILRSPRRAAPVFRESARYLRWFLADQSTKNAVSNYLNDGEQNTSICLEAWLFATLLETPGQIPQEWLNRARVVSDDRNSEPGHRVLALNLLACGKQGADLDLIKRVAENEHDPDIVRGALVALRRVDRLGQRTVQHAQSRHGHLKPTVDYLKGLKKMPSLIYPEQAVNIR